MKNEITISPFTRNYELNVENQKKLSKQEEFELAKQKDHCPESAKTLILSHLRFVAHIAKGYTGYGIPLSDIIQEGTIGLMKAVKNFNPFANVRLASYAVHWIKAEINEFVMKNFRILKVATTKSQRKLFFNLRKMRTGKLHSMTTKEAKFIADELNVPLSDVIEMEKRMMFHSFHLDDTANGDDDYQKDTSMYYNLIADDHNLENDFISQFDNDRAIGIVKKAISNLTPNQQIVFNERTLPEKEDKAKLTELSLKLGISSERVRQIEKQAINKLRSSLTEELGQQACLV